MSNHHFGNDPQPPEPFVLDISDPDTAWPHFKRYMGFAGQIGELQTRMAELEASIVELKARLDQKPQAFRHYPARDNVGDDQC